jgi:hypothetical protein
MRETLLPWDPVPTCRAFWHIPGARFLLSLMIGCNTSPCMSPSRSSDAAVSTQHPGASVTASGPTGIIAPPPSATVTSASPAIHTVSQSRATVDWNNAFHFVIFPTSITEKGDRIAAIVSIDGEGEEFFPEWLVIKELKTDKVEQKIDLIAPSLSWKFRTKCRDSLSPCVPDVLQHVQAANAVLDNDRWRPFPCISVLEWERPERMGPGCEVLSELTIEFQDPQLIISRRGRPLVARSMPAWSPAYHHPACKGTIDSRVESVALDPETGLFIIGLSFVGAEGDMECATPIWDFHPIRLPMFRLEAFKKRDRGAP